MKQSIQHTRIKLDAHVITNDGWTIKANSHVRSVYHEQSARLNKSKAIIRSEQKRINADIINTNQRIKFERNAMDDYFNARRKANSNKRKEDRISKRRK